MSQTIIPSDQRLSAGILPRRFFALVIDFFIIGVIGWMAAFFIVIFGFFTLGVGWLAFHIIPAIPFAYYTLLVGGSGGATPGQRAMGIVVRQEASLAHPSLPQAFVWTLLLWVSFAFACVPFLLVLLNPRHRAAHDILSGLVILRARQIPY
jgi:uncharacterized RDD family membrane protein YckC